MPSPLENAKNERRRPSSASYSSTTSNLSHSSNLTNSSYSTNLSQVSTSSLPVDYVQKLKEVYSHILVYTGDAPKSIIPGLLQNNKNFDHRAQNALNSNLGKISPDKFKAAYRAMIRSDSLDTILTRFLKEKKFNIIKCLEVFAGFIVWRLKLKVDELVEGGDEKRIASGDDGFMRQFEIGKGTISPGRDKAGRPLVIVRVQRHNPWSQSEAAIQRFIIQIFEDSRLILRDVNDSTATIFDMTNFTLSNMDYSAVRVINNCFKYYSGNLGHIYIYNAPRVFEAVWKAIKVWLDPVLVSRVTFTKNLSKYIASNDLPIELKGDQAYEYKYLPHIPGENDKMKDTDTIEILQARRHELFDLLSEVTVLWIKARNNSDLEHELAQQRNLILDNLRHNYNKLDPYIRGRGVYDRNGTFGYFVPELSQPELETMSRSIVSNMTPTISTTRHKSPSSTVSLQPLAV